MSESEFYQAFADFLRSLSDGDDLPDPAPLTHLWLEGYLDSIRMLEVLVYLEELVGAEIVLGPESAGTFDTMTTIYETYVREYDSVRRVQGLR